VAVLVFELGDDMTLKTIRIIFAIWLLIVSVGHAEKSPSWHYQKDQSWERTKSDFPESATPGPFLNRMVEIDAWAKEHDRELYDNSNKPYLMAMMVQQEIDEAKAKETAIPVPITYHQEANAKPTTSWLQDLRGFALACLVAYVVYNIIRPKTGIESRNARGRKWAAWSGVINSILLLNVFFSKPDAALLFPWIIAITVITPVAYALGWIYESIRGKSRSGGDQSVSKPIPEESVESLDDFPSHDDLCTLDAKIYSNLSQDELSEKITRALEDSVRSTAPESEPQEERTTVKKESRCDNEHTGDPAAKWKTCDFDGSVPPPLTLWPGDLVIHLHPDILGEKTKISDFWEMADYGELILTSRAEDFPDGISTRIPSDGDPASDPPNVWRVLAGDRVLLIGERPQGTIKFLVNFRECALVYWRYAKDELPTPMEALQDTEPSGSTAMKEKMRIAVAKITAMGTPHEFSEDWSIREIAPAPSPKHGLTKSEQLLKDAFKATAEGLEPADLSDSEFKIGIPVAKIGQFIEAAQSLISEGVKTPAGLAAVLDKISPTLRPYSDSVWSAFRVLDPELPQAVKWSEVYDQIDTNKTQYQ
jgi:hypothetical protein